VRRAAAVQSGRSAAMSGASGSSDTAATREASEDISSARLSMLASAVPVVTTPQGTPLGMSAPGLSLLT